MVYSNNFTTRSWAINCTSNEVKKQKLRDLDYLLNQTD